MPDTIQVRAVEGRLCPWAPPRGGYVGYARAKDGDPSDHLIPAFGALTRQREPVDVPNTAYYRRALESGDLERAEVPSDAPATDEDQRESEAAPPALPADLPSAPPAQSEDKP